MRTGIKLMSALIVGASTLTIYQDTVQACQPPLPGIIETAFSGEFPPCLDRLRIDDQGFLLPLRFGREARCDVNVILRASWGDSSILIGVSKAGELFDLREVAPLMASEHRYLFHHPYYVTYPSLRLSPSVSEPSYDMESTSFFEWTTTDSDAKALQERFAVASPRSSWSRYDMWARWGYNASDDDDEYNCDAWEDEWFRDRADEDMGTEGIPSMDGMPDEPPLEQDMAITRHGDDADPHEYGGCSVSSSNAGRPSLLLISGLLLLLSLGSRRRKRHLASAARMPHRRDRG